MITSPLISVIIVNWNGKEFLPDCLDSLRQQSCDNFETIVVDNGSQDGSIELLQDFYPWVRLVSLADNIGFAGGNNAGLAVAQGKYIVTLNNDTRVDKFWLSELIAPVEKNAEIGMVASRICNWDDPDQIDSLGVAICLDGMSRGSRRRRSYSELSVGRSEDILFPSACAALYRRKMIDEIGFFDNDFFAYCEDTDLGLRGRLAGWGAVLARDAIVYHRYSYTGGVFTPFKLYLVERNHYWVAIKTFPLPLLVLLPLWTCVRYLLQLFVVLTGRGSGAQFHTATSRPACMAALGRATRDALIGLPRQWSKRRAIFACRTLSILDIMRLLRKFRLSFRGLLDVA